MPLLLEYHKTSDMGIREIRMPLKPSISEIGHPDFEEGKKLMNYLEIMGVEHPFANRRRIWMKKYVKFYMRNSKKQGITQVNWERFETTRR